MTIDIWNEKVNMASINLICDFVSRNRPNNLSELVLDGCQIP